MSQSGDHRYRLKLFITGHTSRSQSAISVLQDICDNELGGLYELEIIDVLEHPELAEHNNILATPTAIREIPPPIRRVIGDLTDKEKVIVGLDMQKLD